ncbi:DNA-binding MarR family transcriptional regulator [Sphingomonas jejuensis]|uniref:DNA-binding MarR family transcriptional regulator n=1 Tax=Sphingomonas jejuensis TaxID=904715 RepID=A0ABX0XHI9_9SPHN|nr:MarR family transcriptional regulator [Sphingomonas jejuensis]NJC32802.1 DNA-binding MarR family transcriptional regulator [Sphingomonas jejuensis]
MVASVASPLFLREAELRRGIELLHFANASIGGGVDAALAGTGLGRAHARALYFTARLPDLPVSELLTLLGITKQSLGRVLGELVGRNLVEQRVGRSDRRQRLLRLTAAGAKLEQQLFEASRTRLAAAYGEAGPDAVGGFWRVLEGLAGPAAIARMGRFRG